MFHCWWVWLTALQMKDPGMSWPERKNVQPVASAGDAAEWADRLEQLEKAAHPEVGIIDADACEELGAFYAGNTKRIVSALRAAQPDEARLREAMRFAIREIDPAPIGTAAEDTLIDAWLPQFLAAEAERGK